MDLWKSPRCSWNTREPSRGIGLEGMSPQRNSTMKTKQNLSEQNSKSLRITTLPLELLQGAQGGNVFSCLLRARCMTGDHYNLWTLVCVLSIHPAGSAVNRTCRGPLHVGRRHRHGVSFPSLPHEARAPLGVFFSLSQVCWFLNAVLFGKSLTLLSWHLMLLKVFQLFFFLSLERVGHWSLIMPMTSWKTGNSALKNSLGI